MPSRSAIASESIDAPLDVAWGVLVDFAAYREWNPFVVGMQVDSAGPTPAQESAPKKRPYRPAPDHPWRGKKPK